MKSNTHYRNLAGLILIISFAFTNILISCKKNEAKDIATQGKVSINVSHIKEQVVLVSNGENSNTAKAVGKNINNGHAKAVNNEHEFDNFSWVLSPDVSSDINHSGIKGKASVGKKSAAALSNVTMEIGKKYRILFYEIKEDSEIYRESAEIDVTNIRYTLDLKSDVKYHWYAYSYNDNKAIPLPADVNNPIIETRTDAPFLYADGEISTSSLSESFIDIQFEHKVSKIELKVDASPMFANNFNNLKANFNKLPLTTQGFGLKSGTLATPVLSTVDYNGSITFKDEISPAIKISVNELYTTSAITNFTVTFTEISLNKSGTGINLITPAGPARTAVIGGFSNSSESFKRGLVTLMYNGTVVGGVEWSKGILYYDPTDKFNKYKISEPFLTGTIHDCNYYWNWNSLYPRSLTNDETITSGDPCKDVLPKNTWRTPTAQDFRSLNTAIPNDPENGAVYFEGPNNQRVYFHEAGWITNNNCRVSNENDGMYWSSDSYSNTQGVVLEVDERGGTGAGNRVTDYSKKYGMTIKCIKRP